MVQNRAMGKPRLERVVIVGASLAGLRAAESLRRLGYGGRLVLIGAEKHLPYDRPPLSKELLAGKWEPDRIGLRKRPYEELGLELRLGTRATALDLGARELRLDDGSREPNSTRWSSPPARARAAFAGSPSSKACTCCERSKTHSRSARRSSAGRASRWSGRASSARRSPRRAARSGWR